MSLSGSGGLAAIGNEHGEVTLVERGTGTASVLRPANGDWVSMLSFTGDERVVIGTAGGRLEVWNLEYRVMEALFCGNDGWSAAWASPDGASIVAGDSLGAVHFLRRV
jgi:hypothetical protein